MSVDFFQRISVRLARNVVLVALLIGFLGAALQVLIDARTQVRQFQSQLDEIALVSGSSAQRAVYLLDNVLAEEVIRGLSNYRFLHQVRILDDRQNVLAAYSVPIQSSQTAPFTQWFLGGLSKEYQYPLVNPDNGNTEGTLMLALDNDMAMAPFYGRALYIFLSGFISNIFLALILLLLFNRLLTTPLTAIAQQIGSIGQYKLGQRSIRHPLGHERDELGFIVDSTNHFIEQVDCSQVKLKASELQLRVVVDSSPNLVFVLNKHQEIVFANQRMAEFYGTDIDTLLGKNYVDLQYSLNPLEADRIADEVIRVLDHGERINHDNATLTDIYHVERIVQVTRIPFSFSGTACVLSIAGDITDRVAAEAHVEHLAYYDTLTDLPNRNLILDRLEMDIRRAQRNGLYGAVMFVDIDDFKRINDTMGHSIGDQLLVAMSERMKVQMRRTDTLARVGGDEFVLSLPELSGQLVDAESKAAYLAEALNVRINAPIRIGEHEFRMSASIGIAIYSTKDETVEEMLRYADTAMYQAKRNGKHRHELFHPSMATEATRLVQLEHDLRQALLEDQFEVYLQPIVSQLDGSLVSAEALLRWQHPTKGLLTPIHFMTFLENSNMINDVGQLVIDRVCQYLAADNIDHQLPDNLRISINVSARELFHPDYVENVKATLLRYGLTGQRLEFEITEGVAIQSIADAIEIMRQLKTLGITFALDDFGTGYSSLSYLKQLPVDTVKIDKSFINDITHDNQDAALVACIMAIAQTLNLKTVAEGVEELDQADWLRQYEGVCMQGYLYSKPIPMPDFHQQWKKPAA